MHLLAAVHGASFACVSCADACTSASTSICSDNVIEYSVQYDGAGTLRTTYDACHVEPFNTTVSVMHLRARVARNLALLCSVML